ncbi:hypothetical protein [Lewinella cohaerens]|uniref:hypothetical protein n=1 Tax=Lewinella cohaerens TaxID=70995 RepID=UPI0003755070|nr:hypothetical protein [Lewinella cohaerens]
MITFLKKLFENDASPEEENETGSVHFSGIKTCDTFGRALSSYLEQFPSAELNKVLPALFELGRSSHPVDDWHQFKKFAHWPQHDHSLRNILDDWWHVLQTVITQARHTSRNGHTVSADCCPLLRYHLPLARAIVWLQIHHQGKRMMPDLLPFMVDCLAQYPYCPEITQQLAQSTANMLVKEDYFPRWQQRITYQYPELMRGRIGQRMKQGMRRAS